MLCPTKLFWFCYPKTMIILVFENVLVRSKQYLKNVFFSSVYRFFVFANSVFWRLKLILIFYYFYTMHLITLNNTIG